MNTLLLIGGIGMQEILVIALIVLLLFGGKKIPELMKGLEKEIDNDESTHRNPKDNEPSK